MVMYYTIDRFEGDFAIVETEEGTFFDVSRTLLPPGAKEGDILRQDAAGYIIDLEETKQRAKRIAQKRKDLFES